MAPAGSMKVESTSNPGEVRGFSDANAPRIIAIEAPAPAMAAINDAISTSLSRI